MFERLKALFSGQQREAQAPSTSAKDKPSEQVGQSTANVTDERSTDATKQNTPSPKRKKKTRASPTRSFPEFFEHVRSCGFEAKTVLDIGVATGTPPLYSGFPDAYFILVEPVKDFIPDLEKILTRYRGEYHVCALMEKPGHSTILKTESLHGSSMMHRADASDSRLQEIEVSTLDNIVGERELEKPVLLKTDCQGGDFDVVKGGTRVLDQCDIVIMEVSFFKFWGEHHPAPLDIINFMADHGFVIYDFLDGIFRPLDNALGQIDIVFVKRDGMLREDFAWVRN